MEFETLKDELLAKADSAIKFGRSLDNSAEFEVFLYYMNDGRVSINQGVVQASDGIAAGNAVRVIKGPKSNKKTSFSSSSSLDLDHIKSNMKEALSLNNALTIIDKRLESFCEPKKPGNEGIFGEDILSLSTSDLLPKCSAIIKDASETDDRIKFMEVTFKTAWGGYAVGNSSGVLQASRRTTNSYEIECMAADGEDRKTSFEYDLSRERVLETEEVGSKVATNAIKQLGGTRIDEKGVLPTIWDSTAASSYVLFSLGMSANGSNVVEGLSPLADKIGEQISSTTLTVIDDGQKPAGPFTNAVDTEGHPQEKQFLLERGVLKNYMFNTYYAKVFGTESTGNSSRGIGKLFGSSLPYETSPRIGTTNLEILPGSNKTVEDWIATIDGRGILIRGLPLGISHTSVSTGEFSVVINDSFLIENGEIKHPLKSVSVAGNFYKGFKNVRKVGGDAKISYFRVICPSIIFDGFSIVA
ncbi:MAG: TldD/PmbA family protein [Candidatus Hodarchaeales archaeon]